MLRYTRLLCSLHARPALYGDRSNLTACRCREASSSSSSRTVRPGQLLGPSCIIGRPGYPGLSHMATPLTSKLVKTYKSLGQIPPLSRGAPPPSFFPLPLSVDRPRENNGWGGRREGDLIFLRLKFSVWSRGNYTFWACAPSDDAHTFLILQQRVNGSEWTCQFDFIFS